MSIRDRLISEFQKVWDTGNPHNAPITLKAKDNIVIWSNDPEIQGKTLPAFVNKTPLDFGDTAEEAKAVADKYNLDIIPIEDDSEYSFIVIPKGSELSVAMDVDEDIASGYDIEREYVSEVTTFFYGEVESFIESMEESSLKMLFAEVD